MSFPCETRASVRNELALRFSIVSKPTPVLEYIKTISSLVGASHILAVFEENDTLKVFFDDKRFVDVLIRSGIHIMGYHVKVDYVVPPGIKVVLSNLDPAVPNCHLTSLLSMYGSIVSPIMCPPVSDHVEFCHIGYGVRYCYMIINEPIPSKLGFNYGNQLCRVKIKVGEEMNLVPLIKTDDTANDNISADPSSDVDQENSKTVVISVENTASESNSDSLIGVAKLPIQRSHVNRRGRPGKTLKIKQTRMTAAAKAAKKIKQNVKHKWIGTKKVRPVRREIKAGKERVKIFEEASSSATSSHVDPSPTPLMTNENSESSEGPLNLERLLLFIKESKHNRAPRELAKKYLGNECNDDMILSLVNQIERYWKNCSSFSLKLRLNRICKLLTGSVNAAKS